MVRLLALATLTSTLVVGCVDTPAVYESFSCYENEICSHDTPNNLEFRGMDITGQTGGSPGLLAIGGTQRVTVLDPSDSLTDPVPFAQPYTTDTSRPSDGRFGLGVEAIGQSGNVITVRGTAEGYSYLRVLAPGGELYGRTVLGAKAIHHRQVRPPYAYGGPTEKDTVVWAAGAQEISVGLWSAPDSIGTSDLLVDESLTLSMAGATQTSWDTILVPAAAPGHRELLVSGGSGSVVLDVETVAAPDAIASAPGSSSQLSIYGSERLCFVARHGTRYVAGAAWSFTMDGGQVLATTLADTAHTGCAYFAAQQKGTVQIHATASGFTQTLTFVAQ